jgi:thymidylate synthase (FAD)
MKTPAANAKEREMNDKTDLLDHGYVRLIDSMGSDLSISRAARVSYDAPGRPEDEKLINYLWEHGHTTPFEAVTFTFEIKAPIFVLRQWHRHRTQSYNELSARYRELPEEFYLPELELIGQQSTSNKQMRVVGEETSAERRAELEEQLDAAHLCMVNSFATYRQLIAAGWPRELARSVLPVATYSHMFVTLNLLNLLRFLNLRDHEHAQYEIRVYAEAMRDLIRPIVPLAIKVWEANRK